VSAGTARATQRNPVSKNKKTKQNKTIYIYIYIYITIKINKWEGRWLSGSKPFLYKYEDLSLNSRTHIKFKCLAHISESPKLLYSSGEVEGRDRRLPKSLPAR
jgi:hypothetical protein